MASLEKPLCVGICGLAITHTWYFYAYASELQGEAFCLCNSIRRTRLGILCLQSSVSDDG